MSRKAEQLQPPKRLTPVGSPIDMNFAIALDKRLAARGISLADRDQAISVTTGCAPVRAPDGTIVHLQKENT